VNRITDATGAVREVQIGVDVLEDLRKLAEANRKRLDDHGVTMIDVMGSVGTGKTAFIEQLVQSLKETQRIVVLNGDLATTIDQDRILQHGVRAVQVNTGKECHLDAALVRTILDDLDLATLDLILVENVGNLICPADFPLGSHKRVVVISVTEGPYVAVKHPHVFAEMDFVIINKIDLAPVMGVEVSKLVEDLATVNPHARIFQTNCRDGTGIQELIWELLGVVKHA
jgi:hydrogenase nickel incorporation protein HypB